jgi:hypothetical protein
MTVRQIVLQFDDEANDPQFFIDDPYLELAIDNMEQLFNMGLLRLVVSESREDAFTEQGRVTAVIPRWTLAAHIRRPAEYQPTVELHPFVGDPLTLPHRA